MQSWFDLEVHAQTVVREMQREVAQNRRIAEAQRRGQVSRAGADSAFKRLLSVARSRLVSARPSPTSQPAVVAAGPANVPLILAPEQPPAVARVRSNRNAEPYAGMVVIARGNRQQPLQEPSGVADR